MKYKYYIAVAVALPSLFLMYITGLGYTPWVSAFLKLPLETEILLFTVQAGVGAAAIGHFIGYRKGKRAKNNASKLELRKAGLHASTREQKKRKTISPKYVALLAVMLAIFIIPFIINPTANFSGTDGQGPQAIKDQGYTPWISALFKPSHTDEILLFSLQVGIGGAIIGYFVGYETGKKSREESLRLNDKEIQT